MTKKIYFEFRDHINLNNKALNNLSNYELDDFK